MSYKNFLEELKKGLPAKNYLLSASDHFLHAEAAALIKDLVPAEERDFNFHSFDITASDSEKVSIDQILDVLNTVPFFSNRKYVVVANAQKMTKKDLKKLEPYLRDPSEHAAFFLFHAGPVKKDIRESLRGVRQIVLDIRESDIPAWLSGKAKGKGMTLSGRAAEYLLATIGPDLGMLSTEIEKLTLIGKTAIEVHDVAEIIEGKRTYNAFSLIEALRARDAEKAFRICRVLQETEEPYALLGALNWQYSQSPMTGDSPADREYACEIFRVLNRADMEIKSSGGFYPMELLLARLLRLSGRR